MSSFTDLTASLTYSADLLTNYIFISGLGRHW